MTEWKSPSDFENDLWALSEINIQDVVKEPIPEPILQYRAKEKECNKSIFDADYTLDGVTLISSGRGRGRVTRVYKPGIVENENTLEGDEDDIKRRLREATGLGFSNELIEKCFKKSTPSPVLVNKEFSDVIDDDLSTNTATSKNNTDTNKNNADPSKNNADPCKNKSPPPPLSEILKLGKRCKKENLAPKININNNSFNANSFSSISSDSINSEKYNFYYTRLNNDSSNSGTSSTNSSPRYSMNNRRTPPWSNSDNLTYKSSLRDRSKDFDISSNNDFPSLY